MLVALTLNQVALILSMNKSVLHKSPVRKAPRRRQRVLNIDSDSGLESPAAPLNDPPSRYYCIG